MIRSFVAAIFLTAAFLSATEAQASPEPTQSPTPQIATTPTKPLDQGFPSDPEIAKQPPTSNGQQAGYVRPTGKVRLKRYVNSMFGPISLGRNLFNSGIATWQNSPEEWGGQWEGFGRRVASNFGRNVIRQTTIYGLDSALKVDSHFYRSKDRSVKARIYNALVSPVAARKPNGKRTIGIPRLTGAYASSIIAYETWYPSRYDYKDGLKSGTISLGFNAAYNLFKEFVWKK
ncbi:MAG: hypothetical protein ABL984_12165 [Pyrinomonadaceae bacterium]